MSWPASDPNLWSSDHATCRCLPQDYSGGSFQYGELLVAEYDDLTGLCGADCEARCRWSWPSDDQFKWKSDAIMPRCMPDGVLPYDYNSPDPTPDPEPTPDPDPTPDPTPTPDPETCTLNYSALSFGDKCGEKHNTAACGSCPQACHMSWPASDPNLWYSEQAACRCLPRGHSEGSFSYGELVIADDIENAGLCNAACEGRCRWSWPSTDLFKWKSDAVLPRCMPDGVQPVTH